MVLAQLDSSLIPKSKLGLATWILFLYSTQLRVCFLKDVLDFTFYLPDPLVQFYPSLFLLPVSSHSSYLHIPRLILHLLIQSKFSSSNFFSNGYYLRHLKNDFIAHFFSSFFSFLGILAHIHFFYFSSQLQSFVHMFANYYYNQNA